MRGWWFEDKLFCDEEDGMLRRERGTIRGRESEKRVLTFFMFSASRSYSSRTSCSRGERSGGASRGLDVAWSIAREISM